MPPCKIFLNPPLPLAHRPFHVRRLSPRAKVRFYFRETESQMAAGIKFPRESQGHSRAAAENGGAFPSAADSDGKRNRRPNGSARLSTSPRTVFRRRYVRRVSADPSVSFAAEKPTQKKKFDPRPGFPPPYIFGHGVRLFYDVIRARTRHPN